MKNIGFAQRVTLQRINDPYKDNTNVSPKRSEVQKEINQNQLVIDCSCFQKTEEEKELLKSMKKLNRMSNSFFITD